MSKKKKRDRRSGWILPYLEIYGEYVAPGQPEDERQAHAVFEMSRLARKAFNRIKDQNYVTLYEGEGRDVQNLFAEAFCEGIAMGLKAADIVLKRRELSPERRRDPHIANLLEVVGL